MKYCKTLKDFKKEFDKLKDELPKDVVEYVEEDQENCERREERMDFVLCIARAASLHEEEFGVFKKTKYSLAKKTVVSVLDRHGYIRHGIKRMLRIVRLYNEIFGVFGVTNHFFFVDRYSPSDEGNNYETFQISASKIAAVRRFVEKTLSSEEAFVIKKYYALDGDWVSLTGIASQFQRKYTYVTGLRNRALKKLKSSGTYSHASYWVGSDRRNVDLFAPAMPAIYGTLKEAYKQQLEALCRCLQELEHAPYINAEQWNTNLARREAIAGEVAEKLLPILSPVATEDRIWAQRLASQNGEFYFRWTKTVWYEKGVPKMKLFEYRYITWTGKHS